MRRRNSLFLLFTIILFATSVVSISLQLQVNAQESADDELFLLVNRTGDEVSIESKSIVDDLGNFHFLFRIIYENNTFMIIHKVNDEINLVMIEEYNTEYFEVFNIEEGIELFYAFHTFFGLMRIYKYNWTATAGPLNEEFYAYNANMNYPKLKVYYEENNT